MAEKEKQHEPCPTCGRCPTCGKQANEAEGVRYIPVPYPVPVAPAPQPQPWRPFPQPYSPWNPNPYGPIWQVPLTPTSICGGFSLTASSGGTLVQ